MVIVSELEGNRVAIHVDEAHPNAWRIQPYYDEVRSLGIQAAAENKQVLVVVGRRVVSILPRREIEIGVVGDDEQIVSGQRADGTWDAFKIRNDDPNIEELTSGARAYREH